MKDEGISRRRERKARLLALVALALQKLALLVLAHLLPAPLDHAAHGLLPFDAFWTGGMGTRSPLRSQRWEGPEAGR